MAQKSLDIKRSSAMTFVPPSARKTMEVAKLIDVSRCIGCKACQSACMEWNDLRGSVGSFDGFYTNPQDLDDQNWCLMRFNEVEIDGALRWLILLDAGGGASHGPGNSNSHLGEISSSGLVSRSNEQKSMISPPLTGLEGMPGDIIALHIPSPVQVFEKRAARLRSTS